MPSKGGTSAAGRAGHQVYRVDGSSLMIFPAGATHSGSALGASEMGLSTPYSSGGRGGAGTAGAGLWARRKGCKCSSSGAGASLTTKCFPLALNACPLRGYSRTCNILFLLVRPSYLELVLLTKVLL